MLACFLDIWSPVKIKKKPNRKPDRHLDTASSQFVLFGQVAIQTVHTAFIQALQIFCISTCPLLQEVFTSEPLLHHRGGFIFQFLNATPGYSLPSEYLDYHQPLQWNGCTNPNSLGPWSLTPPEVVLPKKVVARSQLYHLFQVRLAYYTVSRDKNLDTVELLSFI